MTALTPFDSILIYIDARIVYKVRLYDQILMQNIMMYEIDRPDMPFADRQGTTYTLIANNFTLDGHSALMEALMDSGDFIQARDHVFAFKLSEILQVEFKDTMHYDVKGKLVRSTAKELLSKIIGKKDLVLR